MAKIPVGLQLYTLRDETSKDFLGTLKKVAEMGYQAVEFAGYGDISASDMRKALDELGLIAISSHVGIQQLENELDYLIEYSKVIGAKYIVCPYLDRNLLVEEASFNKIMETFAAAGQKIKDNGLVFCYHNHDFEFEKVGGEYILDKMYNAIDPSLMQAELDLYWVTKGGLQAKEYLQSYKGRVPLVHVKDMANDENRSFAEVGHGIIDYKSIFEIAEDVGVQCYIVEQDQCYNHPPLTSVKMSIDYLKSIGIA